MLYQIKRFPIRLTRKIYLFKLKCIDKINNTDFYSYVTSIDSPSNNGLDSNLIYRSTPSGFWHLKKIVKRNSWIEKSNIIDIGCGKGSALKLFCDLNFKKVAGIEINNHVFKVCSDNFKKQKSEISLFNCSALDFKEYNEFDTFYFYNPFPCEIFKEVLQLIVGDNPNRNVTIIYSNNVCDKLLKSNNFIIRDEIVDLWGNSIAIYTNYDF